MKNYVGKNINISSASYLANEQGCQNEQLLKKNTMLEQSRFE